MSTPGVDEELESATVCEETCKPNSGRLARPRLARTRRQRRLSDAAEEFGFFKAMLIAIPASLLAWFLIIWAVKILLR